MQTDRLHLPFWGLCLSLFACEGGSQSNPSCSLINNTTATAVTTPSGCHVLVRDTSTCATERMNAGLSGFWLKFSCRVSLAKTAQSIQAQSDGQPDYKSFYFPTTNPCYQNESGSLHNPNEIASKSYNLQFPTSPNMTSTQMMGAVVGMALNGVPIFGNFAAPGDDIFQEAMTFDSCGAHPQMSGAYHYHGEPYAISNDDANFIGVMRDGYPIYGRRDSDGSSPTLDSAGGHSGITADSPTAAVYHYHLNQQTSTAPRTASQKQWFLTTGFYRGTPGACTSCN